jgi:hypothetical protein
MKTAPRTRNVTPTSFVVAPTDAKCGSNMDVIIPLQKKQHKLSTNGMKIDGC